MKHPIRFTGIHFALFNQAILAIVCTVATQFVPARKGIFGLDMVDFALIVDSMFLIMAAFYLISDGAWRLKMWWPFSPFVKACDVCHGEKRRTKIENPGSLKYRSYVKVVCERCHGRGWLWKFQR